MKAVSLFTQAIVVLNFIFYDSAFAITKEKAATFTVTIEGMKFVPSELTVKVGDIVIWLNKDIVSHTVTEQKKEFNSREIKSSSTWKFLVKKKGHFSYYCSFHPGMKASLVVNIQP